MTRLCMKVAKVVLRILFSVCGVMLVGCVVLGLVDEFFLSAHIRNSFLNKSTIKHAIPRVSYMSNTFMQKFFNDSHIELADHIGDVRSRECRKEVFEPIVKSTATIIINCINSNRSILPLMLKNIDKFSSKKYIQEIGIVSTASYRKIFETSYIQVLKDVSIRIQWIHMDEVIPDLSVLEIALPHVRGDIIVYMEDLVIVNHFWLMPILNEINQNRRVVVQPSLDAIEEKSFKYSKNEIRQIGVVDWFMNTQTSKAWERDGAQNNYNSPVLIDHVFAMDREYLHNIITFYQSSNVSLQSDLELSFYSWLCGNGVRILQCSRVARLPSNNLGKPLSLRSKIANMWLDDYQKYFKAVQKDFNSKLNDISSSFHRDKQTSGCKPFGWFIQNVFSLLEIPPSDAMLFGKMKSYKGICFGYNASLVDHVIPVPCDSELVFNIAVTKDGLIKSGEKCMTASRTFLVFGTCGDSSYGEWAYTSEKTVRWYDNRCITIVENKDKTVDIRLYICTKKIRDFAVWEVEYNVYW